MRSNGKTAIGIGVDIVFVPRFEKMKPRLLNKLFTSGEIAYAQSKRRGAETYAGIFAAKEAIIKACSISGKTLLLGSIEISHLEHGQPQATFQGSRSYRVSLSISHEYEYAVAFVIVEKTKLNRIINNTVDS